MGDNDWYQDPWGWPELDFVESKQPDIFSQHAAGGTAGQPALIDVPKENWGTRPAVVLDIMERLVYQAVVDRNSVDLIGSLSPNVFGWRLRAVKPRRGEYSRNGFQWEAYRDHLTDLADRHGAALRTDIVSCFASMPVDRVAESIEGYCRKGAVTARLIQTLENFAKTPTRSGLAQRSFASAALANMYMRPLDDVLLAHSSPIPKVFGRKVQHHSFARWMDDMWLFVGDAADGRRAQMELHRQAQAIGLNLNDSKTDLLEGPDVARVALQIEHSAVDDGISNSNFKPLEELVDSLLDAREKASRTSVKFIESRMRATGNRHRVQDMVAAAERMPHVSDAWSRLFTTVFTNASLQDWFLGYVAGSWSTHEWSIAQYARMFPTATKPKKDLREYFLERIADANTSLPLLAVSAQRSSAWSPSNCRAACRAAYATAPNAHSRRVLSLAALSAGESRGTVRKWLDADKENFPILRTLAAANFRSPAVVGSYAG